MLTHYLHYWSCISSFISSFLAVYIFTTSRQILHSSLCFTHSVFSRRFHSPVPWCATALVNSNLILDRLREHFEAELQCNELSHFGSDGQNYENFGLLTRVHLHLTNIRSLLLRSVLLPRQLKSPSLYFTALLSVLWERWVCLCVMNEASCNGEGRVNEVESSREVNRTTLLRAHLC